MSEDGGKSLKILKHKLKDWFEYEKDGGLPPYAVYELLRIIKEQEDIGKEALYSESICEYIKKQNPDAMKLDYMRVMEKTNRTTSLYKFENNTKNASDFKFVEKCTNTHQILEPWQVLVDLGPAASYYDYELVVDVLRDFSKTSLRGLAHTLIVLGNKFASEDNRNNLQAITLKCNMKGDMTYMNTDPTEHPVASYQWSKDNLIGAFREIYASAQWTELIKFLDVDLDARDDFYFQSQQAFSTFIELWSALKPQNKPFPAEFLVSGTWKNRKARVICLDYAINHSYHNTDDIPFEKARRRQDVVSQLQGIRSSTSNYLRIWKCIDLVQALVVLSESPYYHRIRTLFDAPIKVIPEYLLLTLTKIKPKTGNFLMEDLYSSLLPSFLFGNINSIFVLTEVWNTNKEVMINAMSELYNRNPKSMNLSRVLDISQHIRNNALYDITTKAKDSDFALQLAMLASKRDFLHLEHWVNNQIEADGNIFVMNLMRYINKFLVIPCEEVKEDRKKVEKVLERSLLSEEKLSMIFEEMWQISQRSPDMLEYETEKFRSELYSKLVLLFPGIHTEPTNNAEIEARANDYFQQLYRGGKQVDDLVQIMMQFRSSRNAADRETYACMVQNLFDEWKFFPKYPKKELNMTAQLFGKIIAEKKVIDGVVTDIGLKCIIEGLKREGKMFEFAVTALEECKREIDNETGLKHVLKSKQLREKQQDLYDFINNRYMELHGVDQPNTNIVIGGNNPGISTPVLNEPPMMQVVNPQFSSPQHMRSNLTPNRGMGNPNMMTEIPPNPRLGEGTFNPDFGAPKKSEV